MSHNLYVTQSFKLGATTFPGFTTIEHSEKRSQVIPKGGGKLRAERHYTIGIEETLSVDIEDIGTVVPVGPTTLEAIGVRAAQGDAFGPTLTLSTKAAINATAWTITTAYVLGDKRSNGLNVYICTTAGTSAGSGGPTGTGSGIADGTAVWAYLQLASVPLAIAATVEVIDVSRSVNTDGQSRMKLSLVVNSGDGLQSGLQWVAGT